MVGSSLSLKPCRKCSLLKNELIRGQDTQESCHCFCRLIDHLDKHGAEYAAADAGPIEAAGNEEAANEHGRSGIFS